MTFLRQLAIAIAIASLPRYWRKLVYVVMFLVPVVVFSFFVDVLQTPANPTLEQYQAHSNRTTYVVAASLTIILVMVVYCTIRSIVDHHRGGVTFEEAGVLNRFVGAVRPVTVPYGPVVSSDGFIDTTASDSPYTPSQWAQVIADLDPEEERRLDARAAAVRAIQDRLDARALAS